MRKLINLAKDIPHLKMIIVSLIAIISISFSAGVTASNTLNIPSRVKAMEDTLTLILLQHVGFMNHIKNDSAQTVEVKCMLEWLVDRVETAYNPLRCSSTGYRNRSNNGDGG